MQKRMFPVSVSGQEPLEIYYLLCKRELMYMMCQDLTLTVRTWTLRTLTGSGKCWKDLMTLMKSLGLALYPSRGLTPELPLILHFLLEPLPCMEESPDMMKDYYPYQLVYKYYMSHTDRTQIRIKNSEIENCTYILQLIHSDPSFVLTFNSI